MRLRILAIGLFMTCLPAFSQILSNEEAEAGLRTLFPTSLNIKLMLTADADDMGETEKQFLEKLVSWGYITLEPVPRARKISIIPVENKLEPYLVSMSGSSPSDAALVLASAMLLLDEVVEVRRSENEGNFSVRANVTLYSRSQIGQALGLTEGASTEIQFELTETSNGWRLSSAAELNQYFTPISESVWGREELGKKEIIDGLPGSIVGTWTREAGLVKKTKESWTFRADSTFSFYEERRDELTEGKFLIQDKSIRIIPQRGRRYNLYFSPRTEGVSLGIGKSDKLYEVFENESANLASEQADSETLEQVRTLLIGTWSDENGKYLWEIGPEEATLELKERREIISVTGPWEPRLVDDWFKIVMNPGTEDEQEVNIPVKVVDFLRDESFFYKFNSMYKE